MKETVVAERYSRALFLSLQERRTQTLESVLAQLNRAYKLFTTDNQLKVTLQNPLVSIDRKRMALKKSMNAKGGEYSPFVVNFIEIIIAKKRVPLFPLILSKFEKAIEESKGTLKAQLRSASEIGDKAKKILEDKLSLRFGRKMILESSVHPELLAGMIIKVGDAVFDNSLRSRLQMFKSKFKS